MYHMLYLTEKNMMQLMHTIVAGLMWTIHIQCDYAHVNLGLVCVPVCRHLVTPEHLLTITAVVLGSSFKCSSKRMEHTIGRDYIYTL